MTDKERKALKEAFGFEEPDRKEIFAREFIKLDSGKVKKPLFPIVIKFAAAAAIMTAVIGTAVTMPKDIKHFGNNDNITELTEAVTPADSEIKGESASTSAAFTAKTTSKAAVSTSKAVTTTASSTKAAETTSASAPSGTTASSQHSANTTTSTGNSKSENVTTTTQLRADEAKDETVTLTGRDMTVSVDKTYPLRDKLISADAFIMKEESAHKPGISDSPSDNAFPPKDSDNCGINIDISEMYDNSCAIVLANLDEIVYTSIDGKAYTAENINVIRVYKGDLEPNDRITVFFGGGFMPAEEYAELYGFPPIEDQEEYSVRVEGDSGGEQKQGQTYVFFLKNSSYPVPDGAFEPTNSGNMSVFELNGGVCKAVGDEVTSFMISQAENGF